MAERKGKSKVVIIGGGLAGATLAYKLSKRPRSKDIEIILISPKDYVDVSWAGLRSISQSGFAPRQVIPYDLIFEGISNIVHIHGNSTGLKLLRKKTVVTVMRLDGSSTEEITCEVVVIATGAAYQGNDFTSKIKGTNASTVEARVNELEEMAGVIENAKKVVVVGTGMTGVEAAGEIAHFHRDTKVILVNGSDKVVGMMPENIQKTVRGFINDFKNIELRLGTTLSTDEPLPSDLEDAQAVIWSVGLKPSTEFLRGDLCDRIDSRGFISVESDGTSTSFLVKETKNVFAIGDISSPNLMEEPFMSGYHSMNSVPKVIQNIEAVLDKKPVTMNWKKQKGGGAIVMGPRKACAHAYGMTLPQYFVRLMKGGDVLTGKVWGNFGVKASIPSRPVDVALCRCFNAKQ